MSSVACSCSEHSRRRVDDAVSLALPRIYQLPYLKAKSRDADDAIQYMSRNLRVSFTAQLRKSVPKLHGITGG